MATVEITKSANTINIAFGELSAQYGASSKEITLLGLSIDVKRNDSDKDYSELWFYTMGRCVLRLSGEHVDFGGQTPEQFVSALIG